MVFRPHAHVRRSICTSEPLRASTRVSPGFALRRHSSPSFGSERPRYCSGPSARLGTGRRCAPPKGSHLRSPSLRVGASGAPVHSRGRSTPWSVFQDGPPATVEPASWPRRHWWPRRRDPRPAEPGRRKPGSVRAPPRRGDHVPPALLPGRGPALARIGAGCGVQAPWRGSPRRPAPPEFGSRALPPRQFHVLFDPLSRVLFIFRSLYLCAIGLRPVFSLGRNLPPALGSTPKLPDSSRDTPPGGGPGPRRAAARGSHPLRRPVPGDSAGAPRGARRAGGGGSLSRLQLGPPA